MLPRGRLSQVLATASRTLLTASTIEAPAAAGRTAAALSSSSTASSSTAAGFASAVGPRALWEAPQHSHFARTAASSATDAADPEEGEESVLVTDAAVQVLPPLALLPTQRQPVLSLLGRSFALLTKGNNRGTSTGTQYISLMGEHRTFETSL
jgi:hypothetical protein